MDDVKTIYPELTNVEQEDIVAEAVIYFFETGEHA